MGPPCGRHDRQRVEVLVAAERVRHGADVFGIPDDLAGRVEGVARRCETHELAQPGHGPVRRHGELETLGRCPVGEVRRLAPAYGEDPHAAPHRPGHRGQQMGDVQQLVEVCRLDDACLAQHPRVHLRLAGQGPRVALDRAAADR